MKPGTRLTALYFMIQGILGVVWWVFLWLVPQSRASFQPRGLTGDFVLSYVFADIVLFVMLSLLTAYAYHRRHPAARGLCSITCGAIAYAALHCVGLHVFYGDYFGPTVMMVASAVCSTVFLCISRPTDDELPVIAFREMQAGNRFGPASRTLIQIVIFWTFFLAVVPYWIVVVERELSIPQYQISSWIGWVIFAFASVLGLTSAAHMALLGRGTPLPIYTAPNLVVSGPYRFVRNPMAIAGFVQGIGVSLVYGSYFVPMYILIGVIMWNQCVRPAEEKDLELRFKDDYLVYKAKVKC